MRLLTSDLRCRWQPPKALVWEDDPGKVWLSSNSADYIYKTIYPRHGAQVPPNYAAFAKLLDPGNKVKAFARPTNHETGHAEVRIVTEI